VTLIVIVKHSAGSQTPLIRKKARMNGAPAD